ncbi:MAG TPA: uroporphyrinogen decarboxylase family protein [Dehalococcoidia bacterium]|nr:uroporphyrinogen decarboxylase family protein [Dehalococcoidia bacterium]
MKDNQRVVEEKIARIRAAVALEPHDRVPVVSSGGFWPVRYAQKYTMQQAYYSVDLTAECYKQVFTRWNSWDAFNASMQSLGPGLDATGSRRYFIPGRDLPPHAEFQYPDLSLMEAHEYPELVEDPVKFHAEKLIPRLCTRIGADDPLLQTKALAKAAIFFVQQPERVRGYAALWREQYGVPRLFQGQAFVVPMDYLADSIRGFQQGLLDIKQRPQEVAAACEALLPFILTACLATASTARDFPMIFNPQHVSPFISPKDYQKVYWPTFKRMVHHVVGCGYRFWAFLEDKQEQHLECLHDLPKGKVVAHFESTDLAVAKKALGGRICIAGGMPAMLLARGSPQEVRDRTISVLRLFEDEPGFIMTGTTTIPATARPENITAWLDTVREYGALGGATGVAATQERTEAACAGTTMAATGQGVINTWEAVRAEFGEIKGDERVIKESWEELERLHVALLHWLMK